MRRNSDTMIILFDGACNLCNGSVQFIMKRDKRKIFRFASMQHPPGRDLMVSHGLDPDDLRSVVLVDGDEVYTGSDAALRIAVELSGLWPLLGLLRFIPRPVRNFGYSVVAGNRYRWFGKSSSCMMPTEENKSRFLS